MPNGNKTTVTHRTAATTSRITATSDRTTEASPRTAEVVVGLVGDVAVG
jgi:hypothetical protein